MSRTASRRGAEGKLAVPVAVGACLGCAGGLASLLVAGPGAALLGPAAALLVPAGLLGGFAAWLLSGRRAREAA